MLLCGLLCGHIAKPPAHTIREFRQRASEVLRFPLLEIRPGEVRLVADGFAEAITEHRYICYACAIMPDHVHLLIRKLKHKAEEMIANIQKCQPLAAARGV